MSERVVRPALPFGWVWKTDVEKIGGNPKKLKVVVQVNDGSPKTNDGYYNDIEVDLDVDSSEDIREKIWSAAEELSETALNDNPHSSKLEVVANLSDFFND